MRWDDTAGAGTTSTFDHIPEEGTLHARFATLGSCLALSGCAAIPHDTTLQAAEIHGVWRVFLVAGTAVYLLVAGLVLWSALAYRRRDPRTVQAAPFHTNVPLEIAWTVIPIVIMGGLFAVTYPAERHVESTVTPAAQVVDVIGFRWSWRFLYPREHVTVEGTNAAPPELVLPAGQTTEIRLSSSDVIHSFWVPSFLFKRSAIPGRENIFDFTPTKTGVYPARCAEYCGTFHAHMSFVVRVVSQEAFARWLRERRPS
ncbi:MAG: cytochrome c oxidase subunit II [Candidatus Velthaea sp.]